MNRISHTVLRVLALAVSTLLLAFVVAASPTARPAAAQEITGARAASIAYGETLSGSIGAAGESDTYTFRAEAGDRVLIAASNTGGDLWPWIRLYGPDGVLWGDESSSTHVELTRLLVTYELYLPQIVASAPAAADPVAKAIRAREAGTYTILIGDGFRGTYTGSYNLHVQRLNAPAGATTVGFGETLSAAINKAAEMDAFNFPANAGDRIFLGASNVAGDLWPQVRLYDPDGNHLNTEGSSTHTENVYTVPETGEYHVLLADDFRGTYTGSYNLYLQRLNDPAGAIDFAFARTLSGAINQAAEMDTYRFSAAAGDTVLAGISTVAGDLWPQVRLYDGQGNLLNEAGSSTHAENVYTVPDAGDYTLLVGDGFRGVYTGNYNIYLQRLNNPVDAAAVSFGDTVSGGIDKEAEMDTFVFDAAAGDALLIAAGNVAGDLWPQVRLYHPDGYLLQEAGNSTLAENVYTVPNAGEYRVLVSDGFRGTYTGNYNLFLQRLNNPSGAQPLAYGDSTSGAINQAVTMNAYTFDAAANDHVLVTITKTGGDLWPEIRLYDPKGILLAEKGSSTQSEIDRTLPATGTYTILARDGFRGLWTGGYNLNLQELP